MGPPPSGRPGGRLARSPSCCWGPARVAGEQVTRPRPFRSACASCSPRGPGHRPPRAADAWLACCACRQACRVREAELVRVKQQRRGVGYLQGLLLFAQPIFLASNGVDQPVSHVLAAPSILSWPLPSCICTCSRTLPPSCRDQSIEKSTWSGRGARGGCQGRAAVGGAAWTYFALGQVIVLSLDAVGGGVEEALEAGPVISSHDFGPALD